MKSLNHHHVVWLLLLLLFYLTVMVDWYGREAMLVGLAWPENGYFPLFIKTACLQGHSKFQGNSPQTRKAVLRKVLFSGKCCNVDDEQVVGEQGVSTGHGNWPQIRNVQPQKIKRSAQIRMSWFYTKLKTGKTGRCKAVLCSFYILFLLESFRGLHPLTPTGGILQPPGPHFSADFSILNSHA